MKKIAQKSFFMTVCLGLLTLLMVSPSTAFPTLNLGEETELTFYGWVRNNTGMFLENPQPFSKSSNDLATERTWLRGYTDFKINDQLRFWSAIQLAYEPPYPVEHDASTSLSKFLAEMPIKGGGNEYSEYKNINDVWREVYFEWKPTRTDSIKIGRQIAIWGEALTTRVGDVVQPEDDRYSLAFANLEDTRIPTWMIRTIHDIPSINSSLEVIFNPNLVGETYRVNQSPTFADPIGGFTGEKFGINIERRFAPPYSVGNAALGPPFSTFGVVAAPPVSRDWIFTPFAPGSHWVPTDIPVFKQDIPNGWESIRGGFRTNTTVEGYNFGVSYFHTQNYDPVSKREGLFGVNHETGLPYRYYALDYPDIDIIGGYVNKQLTGTSTIPGVLRAEAIYVPNKPFNTFDLRVPDAVVDRSYIKYLVGYDLNSYFYFSWHKDAPFNITLEHVGEVVPDNKQLQYAIYDTKWVKWNPSFNVSISTTWLYGEISTQVIAGYFPWGNSGLLMPIIQYTPPWWNQKLSLDLRYIGVFGNNYKGLGILNSKDMVVLTTQFNW
ncbi:MAG: hypothetical protein ACLQGU_03690 [bacterium]